MSNEYDMGMNQNRSTKLETILLLLMIIFPVKAQVAGCLPAHAGQVVNLSVYNGFASQLVGQTTADSKGRFSLPMPAGYKGVGYLQFNNNVGIEVLLTGATKLTLSGISVQRIDSLTSPDSRETAALYAYDLLQLAREKALTGWSYLEKLYRDAPLLQKEKKREMILREIAGLEREKNDFIRAQGNSYLGWYLTWVTFVRDIQPTIYQYPERIPQTKATFMHTDFTDARFDHSGVLPAMMENYYWLLENSGKTMDSMYVEMNRTTDYIMAQFEAKRPEKMQETGLFLVNLFEKRSQFAAAEHLSTKMLMQNACLLDSKTSDRFEGYRKMKRGNVAPDIDFGGQSQDESLSKYLKGYRSLAGIDSKYKVVIFGFAECPECKSQLPQIKQLYPELKKHHMEVVYLSLDSVKSEFEKEASDAPWPCCFDKGGWNGAAAKAYHVFASPTIYLLDEKLKIINKIVSPQHLEAYLKELN